LNNNQIDEFKPQYHKESNRTSKRMKNVKIEEKSVESFTITLDMLKR
jgi:hypothetical protein